MSSAAEIREALQRTGLAEFMMQEDTLPGHVRVVRDAAREYADLLESAKKYPLLYYCGAHAVAHLGDCGYEVERVMVVPVAALTSSQDSQ